MKFFNVRAADCRPYSFLTSSFQYIFIAGAVLHIFGRSRAASPTVILMSGIQERE
ncbi:MAG: hypothetical protein FWE22_01460 [Firmicutes bacterium]|nr:hypothetical protein [Bacillota bacterium]